MHAEPRLEREGVMHANKPAIPMEEAMPASTLAIQYRKGDIRMERKHEKCTRLGCLERMVGMKRSKSRSEENM
jgi:hypothetical protein